MNAVTFTLSAGLLVTIPLDVPIRRMGTSLLGSLRSGTREIIAGPVSGSCSAPRRWP